ncbi:MAG: elongation factor G [Candidatus Omnitrophica bacterium CG11_big_fil_rev_8_21_14_0_20_63_9]|nr:MAG: elongation factor G [Candidatus Omnitrophica bacterium CG11_big_fil_rev_8_21_14_0_20_63_9]
MATDIQQLSKESLERLTYTRNFGIVAHIDAGKTTTSERILFYTGKIHKIGEIDEGTTSLDWMAQERERGITITAAATTCFWRKYRFNLIDTPGHVDFTAEVERSLKVLDGCVVVFCAVGGVEPQSETVWRQADKYGVPRVAYINKLDRTGADFFGVLKEIRERLGAKAAPLQIPWGLETEVQGVIDLIRMKSIKFDPANPAKEPVIGEIPAELKADAEKYRHEMLEVISEFDDQLMEKYIHDQQPTEEELRAAIRRATIKTSEIAQTEQKGAPIFVPVLTGASFRNIGVQPLLDAVCDYLPSPLDVNIPMAHHPVTGEEIICTPDENGPFAALAFKIASDKFVGELYFIRVYSGTLKAGETVFIAAKRKRERASKLLRMHANKQELIEEIKAGDIAAAVGLKDVKTGDTLCLEDQPILFERIQFPEPVVAMFIAAKTKAEQDKLSTALGRLTSEDPTFRVRYNEETAQTLMEGMGELHLEILVDRLKREFNVEVETGKPQVAYKETITAPVEEVSYKHVKQSGGRGQYGHVIISMEPAESKSGITFINKVVGGKIPKEFIPAVEDGVMEAAKTGPMAGYPVADVTVTLFDGSYHDVDSSEIAFKIAAIEAFKQAFMKGRPVMLEPIMQVEVVTPEEFMGEIIGDLGSRRGQIEGSTMRGSSRVIRAFVPIAEMFGYATAIRSLSQGRAAYAMEPARYEQVPRNIAEALRKGGS